MQQSQVDNGGNIALNAADAPPSIGIEPQPAKAKLSKNRGFCLMSTFCIYRKLS
ncbi:hypothetical protein APY03_2935 [Variovorax sp. WDL1]|nr:hypothetical protein APY03_2935 [Variovorax sp. WDL1]